LNLKNNSRSLHLWQAFAKLFGNDLKDRVNNKWKEYKEANPEASHSHQARFKFHNKKMQEWYEEANMEKKKEVENFDKNLRMICQKVEMIPIAYSKSRLFISFFSHTNVNSAISMNFLTLWRKQLRKFTSLQAGPAPSSSEGLCQNLVVPSNSCVSHIALMYSRVVCIALQFT
jgi:hypothetical protein